MKELRDMLKQLKSKDLKPLKEKWYKEQDGKCPILGVEVPFDQFVIDHCHALKSKGVDESTGEGICRGAIDRFANALEGKITNNFKRLGLEKYTDLPTFLRNLADYLEHNKSNEEVKYIHPTEAPPKPKLRKSSYNKLVKAVNGKQKVQEFKDKRGNFTKALEKLFIKYDVIPEFYK